MKNLVLEGGGVKGVAFCGGIKALEDENQLQNIKNMIGSSAGAICVGLLAVGYSPAELDVIMKNLNFEEFTDDSFGYIRDLYRLCTQYGICKGDKFTKWYGDMVENKIGNRNITFSQVYDKTGIDLTVTGTCLDTKSTVYFNKTTYADMPIVKAVRISMSIPGVFCAIKHNGCTYVDGGILNNYPIWYYHDTAETVGMKLVDKNIEKEDSDIYHDTVRITGIRGYIVSLIDSMLRQIERGYVRSGYWERTIALDTLNISSLAFDIKLESKQQLVDQAYKATKLWLLAKGIIELKEPQ